MRHSMAALTPPLSSVSTIAPPTSIPAAAIEHGESWGWQYSSRRKRRTALGRQRPDGSRHDGQADTGGHCILGSPSFKTAAAGPLVLRRRLTALCARHSQMEASAALLQRRGSRHRAPARPPARQCHHVSCAESALHTRCNRKSAPRTLRWPAAAAAPSHGREGCGKRLHKPQG